MTGDDRTDELKERIAEFDAAHDVWLRRLQLALGRTLVRSCRFRPVAWMIEQPLARLFAYIMVERCICGMDKSRRRDAVEIACNYLRVPTLLRMPFEVEAASSEKVVLVWPECAVGFSDPSCLAACRAGCRIDQETVKRLGGRLEVPENVLEGAPACKFVITRT